MLRQGILVEAPDFITTPLIKGLSQVASPEFKLKLCSEKEVYQALDDFRPGVKPGVLFWYFPVNTSPNIIISKVSPFNRSNYPLLVLICSESFSLAQLTELKKAGVIAVLPQSPKPVELWNTWQSLERTYLANETCRHWQAISDQPLMGFVSIASDGNITNWNRAMEKLTGLSRKQIVGQKIWDVWFKVLPPSRRISRRQEIFKKRIKEILLHGNLMSYPRKLKIEVDNQTKILEHHSIAIPYGESFQIVSFFHDHTEQEKTLKALEKSRSELDQAWRMLRLMADNVPDMIWAKDLENRYLFANKALCEKLLNARDTQEPVGKTDNYFTAREKSSHPEDPKYHTIGELCENSDEIVKKTRKSMRFDISGNVKGQFMHLDVHKAPLLDEEGRMIGTVGSARIVTREKALEKEKEAALEELRRYRDYLEDLVRLRTSELEAFTYSVSHDFKAPLRSIVGFASIMKEECIKHKDKDKLHYVDIILKNAYRMEQLLEGMLRLHRVGKEKLKLGPIPLDTLLDDVRQELTIQNPDRKIEWEIESLPQIIGSRAMLRQVFFNLLSNAVKYTQEREIARIQVTYREEPDSFIFTIKDNGVGFDMVYATHLFKPFQRLHPDNVFEGSGVGLAVVKQILDRHGASIKVESEPNKGTAFTIVYPREPQLRDNFKAKKK